MACSSPLNVSSGVLCFSKMVCANNSLARAINEVTLLATSFLLSSRQKLATELLRSDQI